MAKIYQWVGSILCFLIFVTMIQTLLPSKKYEKYIRFFTGMVLILLVIQPLTGSLRLEDRIAYYFEAISFQNEAQDLSREILGIEKQRLQQVIDTYEQAVERDVTMMAEDAGFAVEEIQVNIDSDQESETYGMVTKVEIAVRNEELADVEQSQPGIIVEVAPVKIGNDETQAKAAGNVRNVVSNEAVGKLRRKVEQYYGLESSKVEIEYKIR